MIFRTEARINPSEFKISHHKQGLMLGSCFVENIGSRMNRGLFPITINPFGAIYNPYSVINALSILREERVVTEKDLFCDGDVWNSFLFHSSFSGFSVQRTLCDMNDSIKNASHALSKADYVVITLGTAWCYRDRNNGEIVNNCHKAPSSAFDRELISVEDTVKIMIDELSDKFYDGKKIIFTVSPIRHLRDGISENSLSKSILRVAVSEVLRKIPNGEYFPAYEIVMDDLRDYRFYEKDMIHPSATAIDYIYELFCNAYMAKDTIDLLSEIGKIASASEHRPFNLDSEKHKKFRENIAVKISRMRQEYPYINFSTYDTFYTKR